MNILTDTDQETLTAAQFQALLERTFELLQAQIILSRLESYREKP